MGYCLGYADMHGNGGGGGRGGYPLRTHTCHKSPRARGSLPRQSSGFVMWGKTA